MSRLDTPKRKRVGPPAVEPVIVNGVRHEALHWGRTQGLDQDGGYVVAMDMASGHELWTVRVYRIDYLPGLETDVQDIFIESLVLAEGDRQLLVTDERGRKFMLDLASHAVMPVE